MSAISIKQKLLTSSNRLGSSLIAIMLVAVSIIVLRVATYTLHELQRSAEEGLVKKGLLLIHNNRTALVSLVEDNYFTAIDEIVASTVREDEDTVYGIFMGNNRVAWSEHTDETANNPNPSLGNLQSPKTLTDEMSQWASTVTEPNYRRSSHDDSAVLEFAAAVISDGTKIGTIRYGLSKDRLIRQNNALEGKIRQLLYVALGVCAGVSLGLVSWHRLAVRKQAQALTDPIIALSESATQISQGEYNQPIHVVSDDEVGTLAKNFETMRITVKDYTDRLEDKIAERTAALEKAQRAAIENARKAGMAEIATGTLHNVGNLLNSALTPLDTSNYILRTSKLNDLFKATRLLVKHEHDLESFLANDPKGPQLCEYILLVSKHIQEEHKELSALTEQAHASLRTIVTTINTQQNYAKDRHAAMESLDVYPVALESLRLCKPQIDENTVLVQNDIPHRLKCYADYSKLLQILVNVISNSIEAMTDRSERRIHLSAETNTSDIKIFIDDTGCGIPESQQNDIFNYGFTTKSSGNGFGLHSCANYIAEMGGEMYHISNPNTDNNTGTRMVLKLSVAKEESHPAAIG